MSNSISLNEWGNSVKPLHSNGNSGFRKLPAIVCKDGFKLSVQASAGHYCYPQKLCSFELYSEFEIMFLSELSDSDANLLYSHDYSKDSDIYEFVPRSLVLEIINNHGGIQA
jgi:hypothetical protein